MKPATNFPRIDGAPTLLRLAMLMGEAWPGTADERAEMAEAVQRHIEKVGIERAARRTEKTVANRLRDLKDGIQRTAAMVDGLPR